MVIGASRGIGLELARQYAGAGWQVHATTRTLDRPGKLGEFAGDVTLHALDVCSDEQIAALADTLGQAPIDVLIHSAGVIGSRGEGDTFPYGYFKVWRLNPNIGAFERFTKWG